MIILPLWAKAAVAAGALIVGVASRKVFKLKHDNVIEESAERIIESQSGFDMDLTPDSEEKVAERPKKKRRWRRKKD